MKLCNCDVQMEAAKKTYHMACKEEKLAAAREANGKTEASVTPDQQKKLHEKVDKCKQDVQKVDAFEGFYAAPWEMSWFLFQKSNNIPFY